MDGTDRHHHLHGIRTTDLVADDLGWDGMGAEQQIWDGMGAVQQLGADDVGLVSHGSFSQLGHALAYDAFCGAFVSVALYAPSDTRSRPYV